MKLQYYTPEYGFNDVITYTAVSYTHLDVYKRQELEYKIVGSTEANSLKGKISNESPVGRALLGRCV